MPADGFPSVRERAEPAFKTGIALLTANTGDELKFQAIKHLNGPVYSKG